MEPMITVTGTLIESHYHSVDSDGEYSKAYDKPEDIDLPEGCVIVKHVTIEEVSAMSAPTQSTGSAILILHEMVEATLQDDSLAEMGEQQATYEIRKNALAELIRDASKVYIWADEGEQGSYIANLLNALNGFLDVAPEPPDQNCSCHIAPPCHDCVEHGALREVFEDARRAMRNLETWRMK